FVFPPVILSESESRAARDEGESKLSYFCGRERSGSPQAKSRAKRGSPSVTVRACNLGLLRSAQDLGSGLKRPLNASTSTPRPSASYRMNLSGAPLRMTGVGLTTCD